MRLHTALCALLVVSSFASPARAQEPPPVTHARLLDPDAIAIELGSRYPSEYERAGVGGTVRLKAFISTAGKADSVRVVSSSGVVRLDGVASETVRKSKFAPARGPDGPLATWLTLALNFGAPSTSEPPRLADRAAVEEAIQPYRPQDLRDGAIYVNVVVLLTIDSAGRVTHQSISDPGCFPTAVKAALAATRHLPFEPAAETGGASRNTLATVRFQGDSVRLTLRGDSDPPPKAGTAEPHSIVRKGPTRRPELKNTGAVQRSLVAAYPRHLRQQGAGGEVTLWMFVDEEGQVTRRRISESAGICDFDLAALEVARTMRFSPALSRGARVPVWVEIPIHFTAGR